MNSITPGELASRIKNGDAPFMLDVREPEEMADGVIAGSVNIPMDEVEQRLRELPTDRDIVVICHLGQRSEHIANRLNARGFNRAFNLEGGMDAWQEQTTDVHIRPVRQDEAEKWATLRARLWPAADPHELAEEAATFLAGRKVPTIDAVFLAEENATALGVIELAVRPFSDGCDSMPVPHVEGWYVEPSARGRGVGRALMQAAEAWSREHGFTELASDTEPWNSVSLQAHARLGFEETERLVKFRKLLK